jgi:hypothetical protein
MLRSDIRLDCLSIFHAGFVLHQVGGRASLQESGSTPPPTARSTHGTLERVHRPPHPLPWHQREHRTHRWRCCHRWNVLPCTFSHWMAVIAPAAQVSTPCPDNFCMRCLMSHSSQQSTIPLILPHINPSVRTTHMSIQWERGGATNTTSNPHY